MEVLSSPFAGGLTQRAISDLERERPELLLVEKKAQTFGEESELYKWLMQRYRFFAVSERRDFGFYALKGGEIEERLGLEKGVEDG